MSIHFESRLGRVAQMQYACIDRATSASGSALEHCLSRAPSVSGGGCRACALWTQHFSGGKEENKEVDLEGGPGARCRRRACFWSGHGTRVLRRAPKVRRTLKLADGDASAGAAHGADGGGNLDSTEANAVDAAGVGESSAPPAASIVSAAASSRVAYPTAETELECVPPKALAANSATRLRGAPHACHIITTLGR